MDLLTLDGAQPKLAGGSVSKRITGTLYATSVDASTSIASLAFTQNSQAVLDASTALGGDLSGTHGSATVAKLQGRSVLSSLPNDGDVLTWVNSNSRWEPVAPSTGTTYYTVLDSTATTAQLNTALSSYNVVYLEPGTYTNVTGAITIPGSKQLIGLTGPGSGGSSYKAEISLVTGGGVTVTMGRGSAVENINWKFGAASTGSMLYAGNAGDNAVVRGCEFSGNGVGTAQWAIQGDFKEVSGCYFYRCYGTSLSSTITPDGGTVRFFDNNWVGHSTDTGANYGLQIAGNSVHVHDCNFEGGTAGIVASNVYYLQVSNVTCVNQFGTGYGIYAVGTLGRPYLCTFSNIHIYGNNGGTVTGFYATGDYNVYDGIYVYDVSNYGILISGSDNATFGEMAVAGCGSAWTASGIYLDTVTNSSFASLSASSSGADGIRVSNCSGISVGTVSANSNGGNGLNLFTGNSGCTFGDVTANSNTANGIAAPNGSNTNCTIVSATTNSNGSDGVDVAASEAGLHFVAGTATGNTGWGFLGGNSGTPACRLDSWYAYSNTGGNISLGTGWLNYATPVADPTTKATNDLLQYTGSAWDAKGAASGDRLGGTLYGSAVDLAGHLTFTADNTYDIGASGATRPRYGYFGTEVKVGDSVRIRSDRIGLNVNGSDVGSPVAGDLWYNSTSPAGPRFYNGASNLVLLHDGSTPASQDVTGSYSAGLTVTRVQGYTMTSGAPAKGDLWEFDGTNWIHARNRYRVLAIATDSGSNQTKTGVLSYAAAASEFSANSTILLVVESYNPSAIGMYPRLKHGATTLFTMAQYTTVYNRCEIWSWQRPDGNSNEEHLSENFGGKEAGTTAVSANYISSAATWSVDMIYGAGGTAYVKLYLVEIRKE